MGEPIKGHMTRVDRSRARGQFVHSVQNKSIQVFDNTLTYPTPVMTTKGSLTDSVFVPNVKEIANMPQEVIETLWIFSQAHFLRKPKCEATTLFKLDI